jgi:hypothetical protein
MLIKLDMGLKIVIKITILKIALMLFLHAPLFSQITQITNNWNEEMSESYYKRSMALDTVIIVLDSQQKEVSKTKRVWQLNNYQFVDLIWNKKFPPSDDCLELRFIHHPGPPLANEEYEITKSGLCDVTIIDEKENKFLFWSNNQSEFFEKTLIIVEAEDWFSKKSKIKGKGVQIHTTGSCKDLIVN